MTLLRALMVLVMLVAAPAWAQGRESFAPAVRAAAPAVVNLFAARLAVDGADPRGAWREGMAGAVPAPVQQRVQQSLGSGVLVRADGTLVTNLHVIAGADSAKAVLADGREFALRLVAQDDKLDVAVLQLVGLKGTVPVMRFGDSDSLQVGDVVLALGNPFGMGQSVSMGVVSALARSAAPVGVYSQYIQTDAAINPGNSGGALIDSTGALVGLNTAIFSKTGASMGIGFALPGNLMQQVVADLLQSGRVVRPWLGAEGQAVTSAAKQALQVPGVGGIQLTGIMAGSPAAAAGLQVGDVLLALAGVSVPDPSALNELLVRDPLLLKKTVSARVWRDGQVREMPLQLTALPPRRSAEQVVISGYNPLTGVVLEPLGPALNVELGLALKTVGVAVVQLPARGPLGGAFGQKVVVGDVLVEINGQSVQTAKDAQRALGTSRSGWTLKVRRGGKVVTLAVQ
jgi:serine protease Do